MEKTRISLDFEEDDMLFLDQAEKIARSHFGCKSTGAAIRAILRDFVKRYGPTIMTVEQEPK